MVPRAKGKVPTVRGRVTALASSFHCVLGLVDQASTPVGCTSMHVH